MSKVKESKEDTVAMDVKREFDLIHEPWILAMKPDGEVLELSLRECIENAQHYIVLAGELPTQDVAVMRLMLAVLHAVFARFDVRGEFDPVDTEDKALERWQELYALGRFPMDIIDRYLTQFEDRFWLFHEKRPFFQIPEMAWSTDYSAGKLNGELSESSNKIRLFPSRTGADKASLGYGEAARWLLYVNAFDDTAAKSKVSGDGSPGAGWLGKLGLIYASGGDLFETLMLNLMLLRDGTTVWGDEAPVWEREKVRSGVRIAIPMPDNPSELYTLQSRRIKLQREHGRVTGYSLQGGEFFAKENALAEQMTVWRNAAKKADMPPLFTPRRHDPSRSLWRDFSPLISQTEGQHRPGIVSWIARLCKEGLISGSVCSFKTASVKYGDKDFFVDDVFSDSIAFNQELLTELGSSWMPIVILAVSGAELFARQAGRLAKDIVTASGTASGADQAAAARDQIYYRLDEPFRQWLIGIDPVRDMSHSDDMLLSWLNEAQGITRRFGRELVNRAGPAAFSGRRDKDESRKERLYTAPEAYNWFLYNTSVEKIKGGI